MDPPRLIPGDTTLIENIVNYLKAKGIFDEFRHECLADVDTKSSFQNLNQRVDGYASKFLAIETWNADLNKNDLRNKLRRHIDESGMLAVGADHVVEQVINPKIHTFFLPKIIEVVHQYVREQTDLYHKKTATCESNITTPDTSVSIAKSTTSDPIADILSFTQPKLKTTTTSGSMQQKYADLKKKKEDELKRKEDELKKKEEELKKREEDLKKQEENKKKEEDQKRKDESKKREEEVKQKEGTKRKESMLTIKEEPVNERKSIPETISTENYGNLLLSESKLPIDKENIKEEIKDEEPDTSIESEKRILKEDIKLEKKNNDETKLTVNQILINEKESLSSTIKPNVSIKKDSDKNKHKHKTSDSTKSSSHLKDIKKTKSDHFDKSSEKYKLKHVKSLKDSSSPAKVVTPSKNIAKEEKSGHFSNSKTNESNKSSHALHKKSSKLDSSKKDRELKHKTHSEKAEKPKLSKSNDSTKQPSCQDTLTIDKASKNVQHSSSQDSSQGSDQEKSYIKEKQKYFSKHTKKESSKNNSDKNIKISDKKYKKGSKDNSLKKHKTDAVSKHEKIKAMPISGEVAKISSRSDSFGSTSSVSSSSNASKDNSVSNSDETSENSSKDKKKKQTKEKDSCHQSSTLLPPPPPPPPSSSFTCELTSSAEMSSMEDTQSSSDSKTSSSEESSDGSLSDSEVDANITLTDILEKYEQNVPISENDFYDIFLYSSSSSEFEGYGPFPEKDHVSNDMNSDLSVSSVHTSELSSFDDEISDDGVALWEETESGSKKKLTLKRVEQLLQDRASLRLAQNKIQFADENSDDDPTYTPEKSSVKIQPFSPEDDSPESKRSLRRKRKVNPRYASSEYTSIFNSRKETFITKQTTPLKRNVLPSPNCTSAIETKPKKKKLSFEKKISKKDDGPNSYDKNKNSINKDVQESFEAAKGHIIIKDNNIDKNTTDEKVSEKIKTESCVPHEVLKTVQERLESNYAKQTLVHSDLPKETDEGNIAESTITSNTQDFQNNDIVQNCPEEVEIDSTENTDTNDKILEKYFKKLSQEGQVSEKVSDKNEVTFKSDSKMETLEETVTLNDMKDNTVKCDIDVTEKTTEKESVSIVALDSTQNNSSKEMVSITDPDELFKENNKSVPINDNLKMQLTLKSQNLAVLNVNSLPMKRKLKGVEAPPAKRLCKLDSGDSSNSNSPANENKPFNSEKQSSLDEKLLKVHDVNVSDLNAIKNDLFCKQRTNNNGDMLGLNSHTKTNNSSEKKNKESDSSSELGAL